MYRYRWPNPKLRTRTRDKNRDPSPVQTGREAFLHTGGRGTGLLPRGAGHRATPRAILLLQSGGCGNTYKEDHELVEMLIHPTCRRDLWESPVVGTR